MCWNLWRTKVIYELSVFKCSAYVSAPPRTESADKGLDNQLMITVRWGRARKSQKCDDTGSLRTGTANHCFNIHWFDLLQLQKHVTHTAEDGLLTSTTFTAGTVSNTLVRHWFFNFFLCDFQRVKYCDIRSNRAEQRQESKHFDHFRFKESRRRHNNTNNTRQ